jgi:hypothetical protein
MVYALAAYAPRWAARAGLAVGLLGAVLAALRHFSGGASDSLLPTAGSIGVAVVAAWALGDLRRARMRQLVSFHTLGGALIGQLTSDPAKRYATLCAAQPERDTCRETSPRHMSGDRTCASRARIHSAQGRKNLSGVMGRSRMRLPVACQ